MNDCHDLRLLLDAGFPIIVIETQEEPRTLELLTRLGIQTALPVFAWTVTDGLRRVDFDSVAQRQLAEAEAALKHIRSSSQPGLYALCDLHPFLNNPLIVRLVKEIAQRAEASGQHLILISHALTIPAEFKRYTAKFNLSLPEERQLRAVVHREARAFAKSKGREVQTNPDALEKLIANLRGLPLEEAQRLARGAIVQDGAITHSDLPEVNRAKFELLDMEGILGFEYDTESFANVGGLRRLKQWLQQRQRAFSDGSADAPKGLMLVGVQGGGKSLAAKAVAGLWGLPLLRMDMGALFNKYIGESERNVRKALQLAEVMAPCVLWIDEIEKGIVGDSDDGTPRRVLGTLLTWLAEKTAPVFVVTTANDIQRLPPELIRKGRLDEIFFVDLPDAPTREMIFGIHLKKRGHDAEAFDLRLLSAASEGFTGAEIEQAIVAAGYSARASDAPLGSQHIVDELSGTVPLSVTMAEQLTHLRQWCSGRAVPAD